MDSTDDKSSGSSIGVSKQQRAADTKAAAAAAAAERYAARRAASSVAKDAKKRAGGAAAQRVLLDGAYFFEVDWREVVGSRRASVGDFGEAREARAAARGASPPPSLLRFGEASAAARGASAVDGGHVLLRSDALPAKKRGRSGSEDCGALVDTVHCELLDYFLTTALQENLALGKDDIVDLALGYLKMAVPRPIPPARVAEHVRDVFPQLLKFATQRASGRPLAAGEAFDPSVHAWDAAATYEDWKRAYEEVYSKLPPDSILPLSILRERERRTRRASARRRSTSQPASARTPSWPATTLASAPLARTAAADIMDLALGYAEVALPRPIPAPRITDHVLAVFPQLRKFAALRVGRRPVAEGEQFNPAVHRWDADATYSDWARKRPPWGYSMLSRILTVGEGVRVRVCECGGGGAYRSGCG